jgi:hypothetical protein
LPTTHPVGESRCFRRGSRINQLNLQLATGCLPSHWSAALAYPIRVALLEELLGARAATAQELADAVEVPVTVARYHLDRLELLHAVMAGAAPEGAASRARCYRLTVPDRSLRGAKGRRLVCLGGALRAERERQGMALPTLAARAGLLPAVLERIEAGQADPRVTVLFRLWESLERSPAEALSSEKVA